MPVFWRMSDSELPGGVGKTALGVAMVRAHESRRDDQLFDDPYAEAFVAAAPHAFDAEQRAAAAGGDMASWGRAFWARAVVRTRFFDDYVLDAAAGSIRQVVLLAAGLDTRAFRLSWPRGMCRYELDLPAMLRFKERVLAERTAVARCERIAVAVALRTDWAVPLRDAGFQADSPTAWLAEGLLTT
jgi:methyltransferase (TIGR00027 family)